MMMMKQGCRERRSHSGGGLWKVKEKWVGGERLGYVRQGRGRPSW